jgi:signal transduction histidine kinase
MPRSLRSQVDPARLHGRGGLGLGLALARAVVTRLGGAIELASAPGHGTVVTVRLPAAG